MWYDEIKKNKDEEIDDELELDKEPLDEEEIEEDEEEISLEEDSQPEPEEVVVAEASTPIATRNCRVRLEDGIAELVKGQPVTGLTAQEVTILKSKKLIK